VNRLQKAKSAYKATTARKVTPTRKTTPVQRNWMITGYGAMLTPDTLGNTLILNAAYEDSYVAVLAVARKIYTFKIYLLILNWKDRWVNILASRTT